MPNELSLELSGLLAFSVSTLALLSLEIYFKPKKAITISELWLYPVKSCGGISLKRWNITDSGLELDRKFMFVDENNKFISLRTYPQMTHISCSLDENKRLTLHYEGKPDFQVDLIDDVQIDVTVWGDICEAFEVVGGGQWVSSILNNSQIKLVKMSDNFKRPTNRSYSDQFTGFSDAYAYLLASSSSIADLSSRVGREMSIMRFRPNIIVDNATPWEEDTWKFVEVSTKDSGKIQFRSIVPCARCKVPNLDPVSATFDDLNEPTATMKTFRQGSHLNLEKESWKKKLYFGQYIDFVSSDCVNSPVVSIGDVLKVSF